MQLPAARRPLHAILLLCSALLPAAAPAQNPPAGFAWQTVTTGLDNASAMAFAPDGRLFLCERVTGRVRVLRHGVLQPGAWATLPVTGSVASEQGLLGIAIDPDFLRTRFVYVCYSKAQPTENVIARLRDQNGVGTDLTVLTPPGAIPGAGVHNSGSMVFGRDGMLYVGTGDRLNLALPQDPASWNGKVLRFRPPDLTVPGDNPWPGSPVWSTGHRNQFGLAVHPATGALYQTENGWSTADEANVIRRGADYGWPTHEGPEAVPDPNSEDPVISWSPVTAPVGHCFLRSDVWPAGWRDQWFVVLFIHGIVRRIGLGQNGTAVVFQSNFDDLPGHGLDVAMGPDGNLWYLGNFTGGTRGADRVGTWLHQAGPFPTAHLMSVSNRALGGSVTVGVRGDAGDLFLCWLGGTRFGTPVATGFGDQWVSVDAVLPLILTGGDGRGYHAFPVAQTPALVGWTAHAQGARFTPAQQVDLTNPTSHTLW